LKFSSGERGGESLSEGDSKSGESFWKTASRVPSDLSRGRLTEDDILQYIAHDERAAANRKNKASSHRSGQKMGLVEMDLLNSAAVPGQNDDADSLSSDEAYDPLEVVPPMKVAPDQEVS